MSVWKCLSWGMKCLFSTPSSSRLCPLDLKTLIIKENVSTHVTIGNMAMGEFTRNVELHLQAAHDPRDSCTFWGTADGAGILLQKTLVVLSLQLFQMVAYLECCSLTSFLSCFLNNLTSIRIPGFYLIPRRKVFKAGIKHWKVSSEQTASKRGKFHVFQGLFSKKQQKQKDCSSPLALYLLTAEALDPDQ